MYVYCVGSDTKAMNESESTGSFWWCPFLYIFVYMFWLFVVVVSSGSGGGVGRLPKPVDPNLCCICKPQVRSYGSKQL